MSFHELVKHPFNTTWRKALVSLPRIVPDAALRYTNPDGPYPVKIKLPAFHPNKHEIPVYVFIYIPPAALSTATSQASSQISLPALDGKDPQKPILKTTVRTSALKNTNSNAVNAENLNLPVLIDFHGGSFILGTPQEQAPFCAQMVREIGATHSGGGAVAISVDYRLGPYAQYPAANEDAEDVVRAVLEKDSVPGKILREAVRETISKLGRKEGVDLDPQRIAISGFSSGGNLALNLALSVKNDPDLGKDWPSPIPKDFMRDIPVLLFYPSLDCRLLPDERPRPPGLAAPTGFFARLKLESELMPKYLPPFKRHHPRASPGLASLAEGGLHQKAKVLLILPELDSLSSSSMVWVKKVEEAGRLDDLQVISVPKVTHGWTQFPDGFLKDNDQREKKFQAFQAAREFLQKHWGP